jgi:hypothetical protein
MAEGLFRHTDRRKVVISALAFGKGECFVRAAVMNLFVALHVDEPDDQSDYRARTIALSDAFVNIVTTGFVESARAIHDMHVHILMDMQGHTRGACTPALWFL